MNSMPMRGQRIEKGGRRPGCSLNKAGVVAAGRQGEKESVCPAEREGAQGEQQEACSVYVHTNRRQLAVRRCARQSVGSWSARTPQRGWQHGCAPAGCGWQGAKGWTRHGCGWGGRVMAGKGQPHCCSASSRQEAQLLAVLLGQADQALHLLGVSTQLLAEVLDDCRGWRNGEMYGEEGRYRGGRERRRHQCWW